MQFSIKNIGMITKEIYSIFHYGALSQKDQRCSPIICTKKRRREKSLNIKQDSREELVFVLRFLHSKKNPVHHCQFPNSIY